MARRSDYTRDELREMAVKAGRGIVAKEGFSKFSARAVAREIGYTIGTIYNIFESHDDFILHINVETLKDMRKFLDKKASSSGKKAIKQLAEAYIEYAQKNYNLWSALFEHNLPKGQKLPDWYDMELKAAFELVEARLFAILKSRKKLETAAKTIWAGTHGICQLSLTGKLDTAGVKSIKTLTNSFIDNYLKGLGA